jgi:hypothetical protein
MNAHRGLDLTGTTLANGVDTHVPRRLGRQGDAASTG